jgi:hypothetical protein
MTWLLLGCQVETGPAAELNDHLDQELLVVAGDAASKDGIEYHG